MSGGVFLKSPNGWIRGTSGRAELQPRTYKPRVITIQDNVTSESHSQTGRDTWKLRAGWMEATLSPAGITEHLMTRGSVEMEKIGADTHQILRGDEIETTLKDGRVEVLEARPMNSKPHVGLVLSRWRLFNQDGVDVMTMQGWGMFGRRPEAVA